MARILGALAPSESRAPPPGPQGSRRNAVDAAPLCPLLASDLAPSYDSGEVTKPWTRLVGTSGTRQCEGLAA
jgi:hypothetical protein